MKIYREETIFLGEQDQDLWDNFLDLMEKIFQQATDKKLLDSVDNLLEAIHLLRVYITTEELEV